MTTKQNGKAAPFQIGQRVRHLSAASEQSARVITWVSKGATCRADQLIATDFHDAANPYAEAAIYVEAA